MGEGFSKVPRGGPPLMVQDCQLQLCWDMIYSLWDKDWLHRVHQVCPGLTKQTPDPLKDTSLLGQSLTAERSTDLADPDVTVPGLAESARSVLSWTPPRLSNPMFSGPGDDFIFHHYTISFVIPEYSMHRYRVAFSVVNSFYRPIPSYCFGGAYSEDICLIEFHLSSHLKSENSKLKWFLIVSCWSTLCLMLNISRQRKILPPGSP